MTSGGENISDFTDDTILCIYWLIPDFCSPLIFYEAWCVVRPVGWTPLTNTTDTRTCRFVRLCLTWSLKLRCLFSAVARAVSMMPFRRRCFAVRAAGVHVDGAEEDGRHVQQSSCAERETRGSRRHHAPGRLRHGLSQRILRSSQTAGICHWHKACGAVQKLNLYPLNEPEPI